MPSVKEDKSESMSDFDVKTINRRIEELYGSCDINPIPFYITELAREFDDRNSDPRKSFDLDSFKNKLLDLENTIKFHFNRLGVDRETALSGIYYNRMIFEIHNTTKFTIRYFSCQELANAFINNTKGEFKLAKVFNFHREIVHALQF